MRPSPATPTEGVDLEDIPAADRLRPDLEASGFKTTRLLWMRHQAPPPPGPYVPVDEVGYDTVNHLRLRWHQEDFPDQSTEYQQWAREIALRRGVQVLSIRKAGEPVAFAQLAHQGHQAEITEVYVDASHRGAGLGLID